MADHNRWARHNERLVLHHFCKRQFRLGLGARVFHHMMHIRSRVIVFVDGAWRLGPADESSADVEQALEPSN
jgi:hypothetical protein